MRQAGNQKELKQNNAKRIMLEVRRQKHAVKSSLSRALSLSFATVSNICTELQRAGYLVETRTGRSTGGRKPVQIGFNPSARHLLSIDLSDGSVVTAAVMDLDYRIVCSGEVGLEGIRSLETLLGRIRKTCHGLLEKSGLDRSGLIGAGIAIPGVFDTKSHLVVECSNELLSNVNLKQRAEDELDLPVYIGNDANMAALAQCIAAQESVRDLLFVYFSHGIGLGIVAGGRIHLGADGYAGELGHWKVTDRDVTCECGQRGCFRIVTAHQLLRLYRPALAPEQIARQEVRLLRELLRAGERGDPSALELLRFAGETIGDVMGSLADLFNPRLIVLGGSISPLFPLLLPMVRERARRRSYIAGQVDVRIVGIEDVREQILKGNAEHVFQSWLASGEVR
jgi:predicted NBD/HSP70 family sugar kinase